jgi:hypothetical protein
MSNAKGIPYAIFSIAFRAGRAFANSHFHFNNQRLQTFEFEKKLAMVVAASVQKWSLLKNGRAGHSVPITLHSRALQSLLPKPQEAAYPLSKNASLQDLTPLSV